MELETKTMSDGCCNNCRWFMELSDDSYYSGESDGIGECRRHAPIAIVTDAKSRIILWPEVAGGDWCGEFEQAAESQGG